MPESTDRWTALIERIHSEPDSVIVEAGAILALEGLPERDEAGAFWARGLAARELGNLTAAQDDLRHAWGRAEQAGELELAGRVAVSWSIVEMSLGNIDLPHQLLDSAEPHLSGNELGRLTMQRGLLFHRAGDLGRAVECYERALPQVEGAEDQIAEVRLRLNLGLLLGQRGEPLRGVEQLSVARERAVDLDQLLLAAMAAHNLGFMFSLLGQTPEALNEYARADAMYMRVGDELHVAIVATDRAALYAQAGLNDEAVEEALRARSVVATSKNVLDLAETELIAARAALAAERNEDASNAAARAERMFVENERWAWVSRAQFVGFMANLGEATTAGADVAEQAERLASSLEQHGWTAESVHVRVAGARHLLAAGATNAAHHLLRDVAAPRGSVPVIDGVAAWTAMALRSVAVGDRPGTRRAVSRGLSLLNSNSISVQALDLRAHVIEQGRYLAELGAHLAIESRRPREFLGRIESRRATSVQNGGIALDIRRAVGEELAALRALETEHRALVESGMPTDAVDRLRVKTEASIRSLRRQVTTIGSARTELAAAIARLGARTYLGFDTVGDRIWAVSIVRGRSSLHEIDTAVMSERIDTIQFALHRLARSHASDASRQAARSVLDEVGSDLQAMLVPRRVRRAAEAVVISPVGELNGLPWRTLPGMRNVSFSVASSLGGWALASREIDESGSLLVVAGPDLDHADNEVESIARISRGAAVLTSNESEVERCIVGLESASVAHFACHGTFRLDNPMFSSLRLADGQLTIYDLERCERLPHTIVLSACNAGQSAVLRGGALLGLVSALIQLGVSSVIAPLTPVNDERSVHLMVRLHTHLAAGVEPAAALARASIGPDGELDPTAAPFICFGS